MSFTEESGRGYNPPSSTYTFDGAAPARSSNKFSMALQIRHRVMAGALVRDLPQGCVFSAKLDRHGDGFSSADAESINADASATLAQSMEQSCQCARAAGANRMT